MSDIIHPTVYKDDDVEVFIETHPHWEILIHCYVYKWNKTKYHRFLEIWSTLMEELNLMGYEKIHAAILVEDRRLQKFAAMFGFENTGVVLQDKEEYRSVYKCLT